MSRRTDTRPAPRSDAHKSLAKCEQFLEAARSSIEVERWDAAGLAAVHSGIAAADAALIASAGLRSASQDHGAAITLLDACAPEFEAAQRRQLGGLLKMKNQVAYEQLPLTEAESRQLVDHAARLAYWARRVVEDHTA